MNLKTMFKHLRRSPYQAMAAILIMMVTFLAVSVFSILFIGSEKILSYFESKPQVTAFFKDTARQSDITGLETTLKGTEKVASMKFVSKQEALKIYQQQNKGDPLLLELVTADILPASLEISGVNISDLPPISAALSQSPIVQEVVFQRDVVSSLTTWTQAIRIIGISLIIILAVVSIFIMTTIIGIKISQKKDEIEIMRLIGATKWYISYPFILEGNFYGLVGAFVGWLIASIALFSSTPFLESFLRGIPIFPVPWYFYAGLLGGEIVFAVILGTVASLLAVSRYLK